MRIQEVIYFMIFFNEFIGKHGSYQCVLQMGTMVS